MLAVFCFESPFTMMHAPPAPDTPTHATTGTHHRAVAAHAWSGMLAVLLLMLLADIVRLAALGQYVQLSLALAADPGIAGLWGLVGLACANVWMQVAIHTFEGKAFRCWVVVATAACTLFFMGHQAVHWVAGEGLGLHTVLDVTHHTLGAWGTWAAWRWYGLAQPWRGHAR